MKSRESMVCPRLNARPGALAFLFLVVAGFTTIVHPQSETGSISGSVTDPSGAVVAGAKVSLMDRDRGSEACQGRSKRKPVRRSKREPVIKDAV